MSAAVSGFWAMGRRKELGTDVLVDGAFPPLPYYLIPAFQSLARFLDQVEQQAELAGDEVCVVSVAGPGADVDDVEGLVDEVADGCELGEDERRGGGESGKVEGVGGGGAQGRECRKADMDVLGFGVSESGSSRCLKHSENKVQNIQPREMKLQLIKLKCS